ncbi:hypothetical protein [Fredinandcohnia quinoae]|uniref:Uncharacterized protein n=1 Tax=Fredinandcohnia quinoae TaxID=2918902 RepID=A0AAW5DXL7_9BACI|nr:hypothetical protein [Fredinandcohnia sp. SECRCQ15]MCH1625410.1 hypothetical protein [Fredinandcohnia sp. SECRCQ15]
MKIISSIALIIIVFFVGYMTGKVNYNEPSREIRIGYDNKENTGQIDIEKVITDTENQSFVDNFIMIYLHKKQISYTNPNLDNPDVYIMVNSPKQSTGLIDSRLWFTNEGAIIGERSGESWDEVDYFEINNNDADYIKEQIEYEER